MAKYEIRDERLYVDGEPMPVSKASIRLALVDLFHELTVLRDCALALDRHGYFQIAETLRVRAEEIRAEIASRDRDGR